MRYFSSSTNGFYDDAIHDAMPQDVVEVDDATYVALFEAQAQGKQIKAGEDGKPCAIDPPPLTDAQTRAVLTRAVQAHLDGQAQALGYDDIHSACTYADEPSVAQYQQEGQAMRAWRSLTWQAAFAALDAVPAGGQAPSADELIAGLPVFSM